MAVENCTQCKNNCKFDELQCGRGEKFKEFVDQGGCSEEYQPPEGRHEHGDHEYGKHEHGRHEHGKHEYRKHHRGGHWHERHEEKDET